MVFTKFVAGATAVLSVVGSAKAAFDINAKTNVALYYGQGPYEVNLGLAHFCSQPNAPDIIPLGFINAFVAQGNGYPGSNFGGNCAASVYPGPGYNGVKNSANDMLHSDCDTLRAGIGACQALGKKILLSIGGGAGPYQLTSNADATATADFLWGAFGPYSSSWGKPRPLDYQGKNYVVDGFDFDIEHTVSGEQAYYITMIQRLQSNIATWAKANPTGKTFLFSAAPQCLVPDANMASIITSVKFDIIMPQFYNSDTCSARVWANANGNYANTKREIDSGFSYDQWQSAITASGSKSANAKIYIGMPGNGTASNSANYYLLGSAKTLVSAYWCKKNFGGFMIWEAIYAEYNTDGNYYQWAKTMLNGFASGVSSINCATVTTSKIPPGPTCGSTSCSKTYIVKSGDTCYAIATANGLTQAQFTTLNPKWTSSTCPGLQVGTLVCVKAGPACKRSVGLLEGPAQVEVPIQTAAPTVPRRHLHQHQHAHVHARASDNHL